MVIAPITLAAMLVFRSQDHRRQRRRSWRLARVCFELTGRDLVGKLEKLARSFKEVRTSNCGHGCSTSCSVRIVLGQTCTTWVRKDPNEQALYRLPYFAAAQNGTACFASSSSVWFKLC
jgi:hypothetical protein